MRLFPSGRDSSHAPIRFYQNVRPSRTSSRHNPKSVCVRINLRKRPDSCSCTITGAGADTDTVPGTSTITGAKWAITAGAAITATATATAGYHTEYTHCGSKISYDPRLGFRHGPGTRDECDGVKVACAFVLSFFSSFVLLRLPLSLPCPALPCIAGIF